MIKKPVTDFDSRRLLVSPSLLAADFANLAGEIKHVESENGQFVAYEINGDVYVMDITGKNIRPVFQLKAKDSEELYKTKARVMNVSDEGNVQYLIYGYSPSGNHAGKNGISVMSYNRENNASQEIVFIPCDVPAQILQQEMNELCYQGDGTVYIMISNTIYFANLKTKEWGTLIENVEEGSCVVSGAGNMIAYNTDGKGWSSWLQPTVLKVWTKPCSVSDVSTAGCRWSCPTWRDARLSLQCTCRK